MKKIIKILSVLILSCFLLGCEPSPTDYKDIITDMTFTNFFGEEEKSIDKLVRHLEKVNGKLKYSVEDRGSYKILRGKNKNMTLCIKFTEIGEYIEVFLDNDNVQIYLSNDWSKKLGWNAGLPIGYYQYVVFLASDIEDKKKAGKL